MNRRQGNENCVRTGDPPRGVFGPDDIAPAAVRQDSGFAATPAGIRPVSDGVI